MQVLLQKELVRSLFSVWSVFLSPFESKDPVDLAFRSLLHNLFRLLRRSCRGLAIFESEVI